MRTTGWSTGNQEHYCKNIGSDTKVDAMLSGDIDLAQGRDAQLLIVWK